MLRMHFFGALLLALPTAAQNVPAAGFQVVNQPSPGGLFSQSATLEDGRFIVFDGTSVDLFGPDGSPLSNLTVFPSFGFPSFVRLEPDEGFCIVAESTGGTVSEVFLGGGDALIGVLPNAYDAVFEGDDHLLVSAATCGFGCGNELWRVTLSTGAMTQIGALPGASGPLALDEFGGLYYGTVTDQFPVPLGLSDVLYWDAGVIAMGSFLTQGNAQTVATGFDGCGALVKDRSPGGALYMTENYFSSFSRLRRVGSSPATSEILLETGPGFTLGNLEFVSGTGPAVFAPYQPAAGGQLHLPATDFMSSLERLTFSPRRPDLAVTGVGTVGPGPFDVTVTAGPPAGLGIIFYCDQARFDPNERAFTAFHPPLFLGLDLASLGSVPSVPIVLDASGDGAATFDNPGSIHGNYALQVILLDGGVVGSTSAANL